MKSKSIERDTFEYEKKVTKNNEKLVRMLLCHVTAMAWNANDEIETQAIESAFMQTKRRIIYSGAIDMGHRNKLQWQTNSLGG